MLFMLMILFQSCTATLKKMNLSLIERRLRKLCFHKVRPCWKRVFVCSALKAMIKNVERLDPGFVKTPTLLYKKSTLCRKDTVFLATG